MSLTYRHMFKSKKGSVISAPQPASEELTMFMSARLLSLGVSPQSMHLSSYTQVCTHTHSCTVTGLLGQVLWSFILYTSAFVWFLFSSFFFLSIQLCVL